MKIARKPRPFGDIDVTSFSDIAFLLIIFFVLTTTFTRIMGMTITIPSSTQDQAKKSDEQYPTVVLTREAMQFEDKDVTLEQLRVRLKAMKLEGQPEEKRFIVLESAPDVEYNLYFEVVTAIAGAGGILALAEPEKDAERERAGDDSGSAAGGAPAVMTAPAPRRGGA